uniref:Bulb-type lectin domain-containing protein n=1 Tax=Fagus sylvatica TaxID=28930 RepID=A0A2N9FD60_FAGSY
MKKPMEGFKILFLSILFSLLLSNLGLATAQDTITPTLSIRDGDTIVSAGGSFELGFFSPGNSKRRYLGIWYKNISTTTRTVVWVANREAPLTDTSGVLTITLPGILVLRNATNGIIWSSNTTRTMESPVGQLLDSGNLVVKDGNNVNPVSFVWQSFDYPCDTLLPGMKIGRNLVTGFDWFLSSWKSTDDPAPGEFTLRLNTLMDFRREFYSYNGFRCHNGTDNDFQNRFMGWRLFYQDWGSNQSTKRVVLNPSGLVQGRLWNSHKIDWQNYFTLPTDQCDSYNFCGANAICNTKHGECECLEGFIPKSPMSWNQLDRTEGCIKTIPLACNNSDGFRKYTGLKLPDTSSSWYNRTMSLKGCEGL